MQYNNKKLDERILARLTGKHYAQCQLAQFIPSKKILHNSSSGQAEQDHACYRSIVIKKNPACTGQ
jgi:hypothetical protein